MQSVKALLFLSTFNSNAKRLFELQYDLNWDMESGSFTSGSRQACSGAVQP